MEDPFIELEVGQNSSSKPQITVDNPNVIEFNKIDNVLKQYDDTLTADKSKCNVNQNQCRLISNANTDVFYDLWGAEVTRNIIFCIRDSAQKCIRRAVQQTYQQLNIDEPLLRGLPLTAPSKTCALDIISQWHPFPTAQLNKYYTISDEITAHQDQINKLTTQLMNTVSVLKNQNDLSSSQLDAILNIYTQERQLHRQIMQLQQTAKKQICDIFENALRAYMINVDDVVTNLKSDAVQITRTYQNLYKEIQSTMTDPQEEIFPLVWKRFFDLFNTWIQNISDVLPPSLIMSQTSLQFFNECDAKDDDCCMKRVHSMEEHINRIINALTLESKIISNTIKVNPQEMYADRSQMHTQTQLLNQYMRHKNDISKQLSELNRQRLSIWKEASPSDLQKLSQIEKQTEELRKQLQNINNNITASKSTVAAMEKRLGQYSGIDKSIRITEIQQQAEEWKRRIQAFEIRCSVEQHQWQHGRGKRYRALIVLDTETKNALKNMYSTGETKIDGAGALILDSAGNLLRHVKSSFFESIRVLNSQIDAFHNTVKEYERQVVILHPELVQNLHKYNMHLNANRRALEKSMMIRFIGETASCFAKTYRELDFENKLCSI